MFIVTDRNGDAILMRDGTPFTYSNADLASRGAGILSGVHKQRLFVKPAPPRAIRPASPHAPRTVRQAVTS